MTQGVAFNKLIGDFAKLSLDPIPQDLSQKLDQIFSSHSSFSESDISSLIDPIKQKTTSEKVAKLFATAIPHDQVLDFYNYVRAHSASIPESIRAYIGLKYCKVSNLGVSCISTISELNIDSEVLRFEFAKYSSKQKVSEFIDNMTDFQIEDKSLVRRIADTCLYFDADAFLSGLDEFTYDKPLREEFYLRALGRSIEYAQKLTEDPDFLHSLRKLPTNAITWIYNKFHFGKDYIEETKKKIAQPPQKKLETTNFNDYPGWIKEVPSETKTTEKKEEIKPKKDKKWLLSQDNSTIFTLLIQDASEKPELMGIGFGDFSDIFWELNERDKASLLAMLMFLKSFSQPEKAFENKRVQAFLKEIDTFKDETVPFSIVALLRKNVEKHFPLDKEIPKSKISQDHFPIIHSILEEQCKEIIKDAEIPERKWKDGQFKKNLAGFITELVFSSKATFEEKNTILSNFFKESNLQKNTSLIDLSSCLTLGKIKPLLEGKDPKTILSENELIFINRLGKPFALSLGVQDFHKLDHTKEISLYAGAIEKLPEDDKVHMVPIFFKFLRSLVNNSINEIRFSPEIKQLFNGYNLNQKLWEKGSSSKVSDLFDQFQEMRSKKLEKFDIKDMLFQAFTAKHLEEEKYQEFYDYAFGSNNNPPTLEGPKFGEYNKSKDEKEKIEAIQHLLTLLYEEVVVDRQYLILKKLEKKFLKDSDFGIDIKNAIHALDPQKNKKRDDFDSYSIIRTNDPYTLFLIGSLAGGSCQRVTGDPSKNKCLLSYPCDGKNQVIVAKNDKGIEARAILRFFFAATNKPDSRKIIGPVLYLEPVYPGGANETLKKGIILSAIVCAKKLNLPLFRHLKTKETLQKDEEYPYLLETINGPAPFEYYDGHEFRIKQNNKVDEIHEQITKFWIDSSKVKQLYNPKTKVYTL